MKNIQKITSKYSWGIWLFAFIWLILVSLDYINKHPAYFSSVEYFQYTKLYIFLAALIALIAFMYTSDKWPLARPPINGLSILAYMLIVSIACIVAHKNYSFSPTDTADLFHFFANAWILCAIVFFMLIAFYAFGDFIHRICLKSMINSNPVMNLALGIMAYCLVLFLLASIGMFQQAFLILVLVIFAGINYKAVFSVLKKIFLNPWKRDKLSVLGIVSFCILVYLFVLQFLANIAPYPAGFDSLNYYMNISQMVAKNQSLVEGYQPYYWSLFMATGYSILGRAELALELSFVGIVLVVIAAYRLAVYRLGLDKNLSLFCLLLFAIAPAQVNQMYTELKVDFAMLFFQILVLEYVLILLKRLNKDKEDKNNTIRKMVLMAIFVGLLSSFALGIKMLNMFMVFTVLVLFWWNGKDKAGIVGILCFSLLLFIVSGTDELSGLDKYHLSRDVVKIVLVVMMLVAFGMSFVKHKSLFIKRVVVSAVFGFSTVILILPWMAKNFSETKSLNPRTLLMGKSPGPGLNMSKIIKNYEKTKDQ